MGDAGEQGARGRVDEGERVAPLAVAQAPGERRIRPQPRAVRLVHLQRALRRQPAILTTMARRHGHPLLKAALARRAQAWAAALVARVPVLGRLVSELVRVEVIDRAPIASTRVPPSSWASGTDRQCRAFENFEKTSKRGVFRAFSIAIEDSGL